MSDAVVTVTLPVGQMAWIKKELESGEIENLFHVKLPGPGQHWQHYTNIPAIALLGGIPAMQVQAGDTPQAKDATRATLQDSARVASWSDGWFAYLALLKQGWKLISEKEVLAEMHQALCSKTANL
jgi:hypothetical protein